MAMIPGDDTCTTGLAARIWSKWSAAGRPGAQLPGEGLSEYATRSTNMKKMAADIAAAMVEEVVANAELTLAAGVDSLGGVHGPSFPLTGKVK